MLILVLVLALVMEILDVVRIAVELLVEDERLLVTQVPRQRLLVPGKTATSRKGRASYSVTLASTSKIR